MRAFAMLGILLLAYAGASCRPSKPAALETNAAATGPGRAVLAAERERGFQLSEAAIATLGIRWQALASGPPFRVPLSSLVFHQAETGVYRIEEGWFRLVPVDPLALSSDTAQIESDELAPGHLVVTQGAPFLRVTELELFGESAGAHVH